MARPLKHFTQEQLQRALEYMLHNVAVAQVEDPLLQLSMFPCFQWVNNAFFNRIRNIYSGGSLGD